MKIKVQSWFKKHSSKVLDQEFKVKDCCVERVLTQEEALKSVLLAD
jgi:hypothetical protein